MRVIVGKEYESQTPAFSDQISYLEFYPHWNLPQSIVQGEILKKAKEDLEYLERNHYEIIEGYDPESEVLSTNEENLEKLAKGEVYLRQKPGPHNALGLIKFMFPNEYAVYLHDTPQGHLFQRDKRAFSHGCIRVEHPDQLGAFILSQADESWTPEKVRKQMDQLEHQIVKVSPNVNIHLVYHSVVVSPEGRLTFLPDVYNLNGT